VGCCHVDGRCCSDRRCSIGSCRRDDCCRCDRRSLVESCHRDHVWLYRDQIVAYRRRLRLTTVTFLGARPGWLSAAGWALLAAAPNCGLSSSSAFDNSYFPGGSARLVVRRWLGAVGRCVKLWLIVVVGDLHTCLYIYVGVYTFMSLYASHVCGLCVLACARVS